MRILRALTRGTKKQPPARPAPVQSTITLGELQDRRWAGVPCLFALSTGRVGTATLAAILNSSPKIAAIHEPTPRLLNASLRAYQSTAAGLDDMGEAAFAIDAARAEFVWRSLQKGKIYAETNNRLTFLAPALSKFFPESKFVLLHRHPVEVIRSGFRRGWYAGHVWDWARIQPVPGSTYADSWAEMTQIQKIAWYWMEINRFSLECLSRLSADRAMTVDSRQLFSGDRQALTRIFSLIGVDVPDDAVVRKVLEKNLNASSSESRISEADAKVDRELSDPRTQEMLAPIAAKLGYDLARV
jgi:hypothetical protein